MKYTIQQLDGRYTYHNRFRYYIGFAHAMGYHQGPLHFDQCLQWFVKTHGWSAEIRQYTEMYNWFRTQQNFHNHISRRLTAQIVQSPAVPDSCNPYWSWSNTHKDLRIYVKSAAELTFFQLTFPVDQ